MVEGRGTNERTKTEELFYSPVPYRGGRTISGRYATVFNKLVERFGGPASSPDSSAPRFMTSLRFGVDAPADGKAFFCEKFYFYITPCLLCTLRESPGN